MSLGNNNKLYKEGNIILLDKIQTNIFTACKKNMITNTNEKKYDTIDTVIKWLGFNEKVEFKFTIYKTRKLCQLSSEY